MDTDTHNATFRISEHAIAQEVGGELIVLDMTTERYLSIDRVGRKIWGLLDEGRTIPAVVDELTAHYGIDRARIHDDVSTFITQLEQLGLGELTAR